MADSVRLDDRTMVGRQRKTSKMRSEMTFRNLTVLGCSYEELSRESGTAITPSMFDKPNKRGLQSICFFLFSKLDHQRAAQMFKFCYPTYNSREDYEFQKICVDWLKEIVKSNPGINFPLISPTLFTKTTSPVNLLFPLSSFVLYKCTKRLCPQDDFVLQPPSKSQSQFRKNALKSATSSAMSRLVHNLQISKECDDAESLFEVEMLDDYRRKLRLLEELKNKKKILMKKLFNSNHDCDDDQSEDVISRNVEETKSDLLKIREFWNSIGDCRKEVEHLREIIQLLLSDNTENELLSAAKLDVKIPQEIIPDTERSNPNKEDSPTQLDLVSFIKIVNKMCRLLLLKLQGEFSNFQCDSTNLNAQAIHHSKKSSELLDLKEKIRHSLAETKKKVDEFSSEVDARQDQEKSRKDFLIPGLPQPEFVGANARKSNGNLDVIGLGFRPLIDPREQVAELKLNEGGYVEPNLISVTELERLPCQVKPLVLPPVYDTTLLDVSDRTMTEDPNPVMIPSLVPQIQVLAPVDHGASLNVVDTVERRSQHPLKPPSKIGRSKDALSDAFKNSAIMKSSSHPVDDAIEQLSIDNLHGTPKSVDVGVATGVEKTFFDLDDAINEVVNFAFQETAVLPGHIPSVASPDDDCKLTFDLSSYLHSTSLDG